jgi:hypothetical protein
VDVGSHHWWGLSGPREDQADLIDKDPHCTAENSHFRKVVPGPPPVLHVLSAPVTKMQCSK